VLVTTHDMAVAQEICDRIGIIDQGKLITCKPTRELISVFSDQVYDFELDRMPALEVFERIDGVHNATVHAENGAAPLMRLRVSDDETERSRALYEAVGLLHAQGFVLRGVSRHEQTLEDVFLRLTETTV